MTQLTRSNKIVKNNFTKKVTILKIMQQIILQTKLYFPVISSNNLDNTTQIFLSVQLCYQRIASNLRFELFDVTIIPISKSCSVISQLTNQ